jgi:ESX secretion-associated protein EspA/E
MKGPTTVVRPPPEGRLVRWPVCIRWYAVTRRRGLSVWVSWESQRVMANWLAIRCGGNSPGLWTVKVIGELIEGIAGRAGLNNVREVGERLTKSDRGPFGGRAGEVAGKLLDAAGSDLLDFGQLVITGLKSTTGDGDPDSGEIFGQAQTTFDGVNETLKSAVPVGWDGSGSYAYADQNTRQQLRSEAMADADHEVHKVLYREAAQITLRRGYLDDQSNFLANTSHVTFPLQFIPRYGEAMKLAVEIAALQAALGESFYQINRLQSDVAQNAAELQQAVGRYSGVAGSAELPGAAVTFDPPLPPPGGGVVAGMTPIERPQQSVAPGGIARPSGVSGGIDVPPGGGSGPVMRPDQTTGPWPLPMQPGLPPLPQVAPLGSLLSPLGGLVAGAMPAVGQLAATPGQRHAKKARPRDDEPSDDKDKADDDKDPTKATSGDGESERAPVHADRDPKSDRLQAPVAARLGSDNPPGPPAGTPPQDRR